MFLSLEKISWLAEQSWQHRAQAPIATFEKYGPISYDKFFFLATRSVTVLCAENSLCRQRRETICRLSLLPQQEIQQEDVLRMAR